MTGAPTAPSVIWWKRLAVICFFSGAGIALVLAAIIGSAGWYEAHPHPPRMWNASAIVSSGPPNFDVNKDGKTIDLSYSLQNTSNTDYKIDSDAQIRLMVKLTDGALSPPLAKESASVRLPVFIPAGQKALLICALVSSEIPQRIGGETDEQYHERLRAVLNKADSVASFAIFDEDNRYQINLPRWLSQKPSK